MYTIDASVYVNASDSREEGQEESEQFLHHILYRAIPVVAPTLVITEVAAAIGRGRGDLLLAQNIAQRISNLSNITFVDLNKRLALLSANIAAEYRLRGSDAVYAAVALYAHTTLVTRDKEQIHRLNPLMQVLTPTEALTYLERGSSAKDSG